MTHRLAKQLESGKVFRPSFEEIAPESLTTTVQKRLIVCCDGTWFASDKGTKNLPSNVARIGRLIANEGLGISNITGFPQKLVKVPQIVYYQSGVGTGDLTWVDKHVQGAFGQNLDENVCSAYNFLCNNYAPGDEIFLFGFSRGAYTARALSGLILAAGFLPPGEMTEFYGMYQAYKAKEEKQAFNTTAWWIENAKKLGMHYEYVNIKFLGVWDTVGALGLPDSYMSRFLGSKKNHQFHDTKLNGRIQRAAHALALDEYRGTFSPTLWYQDAFDSAHSHMIQCWFPGYHSHIGGGTVQDYDDESSIDDITLAWMVDQTKDYLTYNPVEIARFVAKQKAENAHKWGEGTLTDSGSYAYQVPGAGGWKTRTPGKYDVAGEEGSTAKKDPFKWTGSLNTNEYIHPSVRYRMGLMKNKPTSLGRVNGWVYGTSPIEKYDPPALKGYTATAPIENNHYWTWNKEAEGTDWGAFKVKEYRIAPTYHDEHSPIEGLERKIVPKSILEELDAGNNYGETADVAPHDPQFDQIQHGFQPNSIWGQG